MKASSWSLSRAGVRAEPALTFLNLPKLFAHQVDEESLIVNGDIMP
ncbi:hypothetical protein PWG15_18060 [Ensifer adhaerens]|nr:hypothetical protein [Ensifer adhaerens]WDZ76476.1 hypothetical protein PWG15_18060 [Ensifer adhaerens]